jgi:hypothetical protein
MMHTPGSNNTNVQPNGSEWNMDLHGEICGCIGGKLESGG